MFSLFSSARKHSPRTQKGINMVDLMIWMVIAAMLAAVSFQSYKPYREAAIIYQMKSDIDGVVSISGANGTHTGTIQDAEVEAAVEKSKKSEGITISWGKFALYEETPPDANVPAAFSGKPAMELASAVMPTGKPAAVPGQTVNTYVLVARHPEVPSLRVVYFFDNVHEYKRGVDVITIDKLPPIQDMFGITPDPSDIPVIPEATPTPGSTSAAPSVEPTSTASPAPSITELPALPTETPSPSASATPTPTLSPSVTPSATTAPTTSPTSPPATQPTAAPTASSSPTVKPEDPTPEPNPLTPGDNLDPKTKKFLFCHDGMMHSNSYTGMIQGHEHHPNDIMPPIPPKNFPGWNWTYKNAQTFYNNCVPVTP